MRKYAIIFLCLVAMAGTGCYLTETKVDKITGQEITNMESITTQAQGYITPIAPIVNAVVPGSGLIIGGIVTLLGLIGTTTTALVKSHRKGGALAAVIHGVQLANDDDTKAKIKSVAGDLGVGPYLKSVVKKYYPTKSSA